MDFFLLGISIGYGLSFYLMYTRMKPTANSILRWLICITLGIIGITGATIIFQSNYELRSFFLCLCIPLTYYILDRLFKQISIKLHNRDYILWVNGSSEIDDRIFAENPHVKTSDKIFSISLITVVVAAAPILITLFST